MSSVCEMVRGFISGAKNKLNESRTQEQPNARRSADSSRTTNAADDGTERISFPANVFGIYIRPRRRTNLVKRRALSEERPEISIYTSVNRVGY